MSRFTSIFLTIFCACILVSGCAGMQPLLYSEIIHKSEKNAAPLSFSPEEILIFNSRLANLSPHASDIKYKHLNESFKNQKNDTERLKLVILALTPDHTFSSHKKAQALLKPMQEKISDFTPRQQGLIILLGRLVAERLEVDAQLAAEKKRADTLAQHLHELKKIEEIMNLRGKPSLLKK